MASVAALVAVCFLMALADGAQAQAVQCLTQGVVLAKPREWCAQNGQASAPLAAPDVGSLDAIKLLQMRLTSLGLNPGPIDGYIGPATLGAVREFQRKAGLVVDGAITEALAAKLAAAADEKTKEWAAKNTPRPPIGTNTPASSPPAPKVVQQATSIDQKTMPKDESPVSGLLILAAILGLFGVGIFAIVRGVSRWRWRSRVADQLAAVTDVQGLQSLLGSMTPQQLQMCTDARAQWYRTALATRLRYGQLDDQSAKEMEAFRDALKLEGEEAGIFAAMAAEQILSGNCSLEQMSASLIKMTPSQLQSCVRQRAKYFGDAVSDRMSGGMISDAASTEMDRLQAVLQLGSRDIEEYAPKIARAQNLYHYNAGRLPILTTSPVLLTAGEKLHFSCGAKLVEQRVVARRTVGGSRGVSIRVVKGVSFRVGAYRGTSVSERGPVVVSRGDFCVTSDRLLFSGDQKSFSFDWSKLLSVHVASDGIQLSPASGAVRLLLFTTKVDTEMLIAILNGVYSQLRTQTGMIVGRAPQALSA